MSESIEKRIEEVLLQHTPKQHADRTFRPGFTIWRDGCSGCDWIGDDHVGHQSFVVADELGLVTEQRTLADGSGGISTNYLTGETTVHSKPCTRQSRRVTAWETL